MNSIISTFDDELDFINSPDFKLGEYIYMGMAKDFTDTTRCISVGYKIDYCYRHAKEFAELFPDKLKFTHINKVKVGDLSPIAQIKIIS